MHPNPQVFVVADGGLDLEHYELRSFKELRSILLQVQGWGGEKSGRRQHETAGADPVLAASCGSVGAIANHALAHWAVVAHPLPHPTRNPTTPATPAHRRSA